jgi:hypothetical protein
MVPAEANSDATSMTISELLRSRRRRSAEGSMRTYVKLWDSTIVREQKDSEH